MATGAFPILPVSGEMIERLRTWLVPVLPSLPSQPERDQRLGNLQSELDRIDTDLQDASLVPEEDAPADVVQAHWSGLCVVTGLLLFLDKAISESSAQGAPKSVRSTLARIISRLAETMRVTEAIWPHLTIPTAGDFRTMCTGMGITITSELLPFLESASVALQTADFRIRVVIPARAYLRAMWNLFWSAIRHPLSETTIDLSTGRVLYRT